MLDISEIIPGRLWVGAFVRPGDIAELKRIGVTSVISMQTDEDLQHCGISPQELASAYSKSGMSYVRLPVTDFDREELARSLPDAVAEIVRLLASPANTVYVHCTAGVNRSATAAAGYLIRSRGITAWGALSYVTSRRNCDPSLDILEDYEMSFIVARRDIGQGDTPEHS